MSCTVFILHLLQKDLLVLCSIGCLVLRIDIHSIVPLPKRSQLLERIEDISKMYFGHWEPLGVSESCQTRIPGWSNSRVDWNDAVAFRCTWEHLGAPGANLGATTTSLGAPGTPDDRPGCADRKPGCADNKPGSTSNHSRAVCE